MLQIRNAPLIRLLFSHLGDVHADNPLRLEPVSSADAVPAISRENVEAIGSGHGTTIFGLGRLLEVITHRWFCFLLRVVRFLLRLLLILLLHPLAHKILVHGVVWTQFLLQTLVVLFIGSVLGIATLFRLLRMKTESPTSSSFRIFSFSFRFDAVATFQSKCSRSNSSGVYT